MVRLHFGGVVRCHVCGSLSSLHVEHESLRETCICVRCKAKNRQRQIAYVVCQVVGRTKNRRIDSLRTLSKVNDFVVYNTEAMGPIHDQLSTAKNYVCSEYLGDCYKSGDLVDGMTHQDLMDLSLHDESIHLVISSDVLEHIPDPYKAHEEIYRVLKRGGRHIFTVPFCSWEFRDEKRAAIDTTGNLVLLKEPIFHPDPLRSEGSLVYNIFSLEMLVNLRRIGFRTNFYHLYMPFYGILGPNALVFEAIKE